MVNHDEKKLRERERPYFVDLNGDGLPEMVKAVHIATGGSQVFPKYTAFTRVWLNSPQGFGNPHDYDNGFFPDPVTLEQTPPPDYVNYPGRSTFMRKIARGRAGKPWSSATTTGTKTKYSRSTTAARSPSNWSRPPIPHREPTST